MKKTLKRMLAFALCLAVLFGFAVAPEAGATPTELGQNVIYATAGEPTYVPAGYTYVYEDETGLQQIRQFPYDVVITTTQLTPEQSMALADLEQGKRTYVNVDGRTLASSTLTASDAALLSDQIMAALNGDKLKEEEPVNVLYAPYASMKPVRALITFDAAPVAEMEGMTVALSTGLGQAEAQAAASIKAGQMAVLAQAEKALGHEIEVDGQFTLLSNAVSATVNYGDLYAISQIPGIKSATIMPSFELPATEARILDGTFTPSMTHVGPGMGANDAWDLGYKGEGMAVAVIDTGISYDNPAFFIQPEDQDAVAFTRQDIAAILDEYELNAETRNPDGDTSIDTVYYDAKIPFGFNYGDNWADFGVDYWEGHGSHVAGIIAGNLPEEVKPQISMEQLGIAPEAQIIVMKVMDDYGDIYFDSLLAAIEDCIILGVDVANMSLGAPSGPVYLEGFTEFYDRAYEAGINIVVSAGNDYHAGYGSLWGNDMVKSDSVSTGTVGQPGSYNAPMTVASMEGDMVFNTRGFYGDYMGWYDPDRQMYPTMTMIEFIELPDVPEGKGFRETLKGKDYAWTFSTEDAEGKLLFVEFESGNCDELIAMAAEAGALGLVLVGQEPAIGNGYEYSEATATRFDIPTVVVGELVVGDMVEYNPETIHVYDTWYPNAVAGEMSDFSSWGPTEGLTLKPEITGIGGDVFSAYYDSDFAVLSGTSMSAPTISATAALIRQYLRENALVAEEDMAHVVNCLLMSSATPIFDEKNETYYFVRRQGAGLANAATAIEAGAYITVEGTNKAKLELGDDPKRTGEYEMTFTVVNLEDTDKTYTLDTIVLGQKAEGGQYRDGKVTYLTAAHARNLEHTYTTNLTGNTLTVPAGSTAVVTVTVTLTEDEMEYYDERFPAGAYVEGFVRLTGLETGNLSVPFLAFYGEFDDAPILETGSAASLLGGEHAYGTADHIHNQLVGSVKIYEELNANSAYQAEHILGDTRDALSVKVPRKDFRFDLMWEWAMPFYHEHQGISPNSDGNLDYFTWKYALRRNVENIHYTVTNRQTGEVIFEQDTGFVAKTFNKTYAAGVEMSLEWLFPLETDGWSYWYNTDVCLLENNTWVDLTAEVTLEGHDKPTETLTMPLYIDMDPPITPENYVFDMQIDYPWPDFKPTPYYAATGYYDEMWYHDFGLSLMMQYEPEYDYWSTTMTIFEVVEDDEPSGGVDGAYFATWCSEENFNENYRVVDMFYDYAGNIAAYMVEGGKVMDYVEPVAEKTTIQVGEKLTINDVAVTPFNTRPDWSLSDETVAQFVDVQEHSATIEGLSHGKVKVYCGFGTKLKAVEIQVIDPAFEALRTKFTDVPGHWAEEDILTAVYKGLFKGVSDTSFNPNGTVTRGQVVTVLHRMAGEPEAGAEAAFTDLKSGAYYEEAVHWAAENGIVTGMSKEIFAPDAPVTREQFATFLYRYAQFMGADVTAEADLSQYTDAASVSGYAQEAMAWAVEAGLINGMTETTLAPAATATRAQAATILIRYTQR